MLAKEIKPGSVVNYQAMRPIIIETVNVQSPSARGAATLYKFRGRHLVTGQKTDITLKGTESLDAADFERRAVNLMYSDATHVHLLDQTDYNQYSLPLEDVADQMQYITESLAGHDGAVLQRRVRRTATAPDRRADDHRVRPGGARQFGDVADQTGEPWRPDLASRFPNT
jgi:translation elongation factor P/translation initiation factor 5A